MVSLSFIQRRRGELERYEMMDVARLECHVLSHLETPRNVEDADLYAKYGFHTFVID
jgi:hypothetical protein